jgi:flavin reductase (DIM6/NTAB) family NADH-FMN oxidoreductase RutF
MSALLEARSVELRRLMSHFPTGVTVVAATADGVDYGMTANSLTSVSLEPPLIAVCLRNASRTGRAITAAGGFAVTFLAASQADLARRFATPGLDQFAATRHARTAHGHPYLLHSVGVLGCTAHAEIDAGDHCLYIGAVCEIAIAGGDPLLFHRSKLGPLPADRDHWREFDWFM